MKVTTAFWDMAPYRIALMIESVRTAETSGYFFKDLRHHIPEGCHLQPD
jgi:hypothetical protein